MSAGTCDLQFCIHQYGCYAFITHFPAGTWTHAITCKKKWAPRRRRAFAHLLIGFNVPDKVIESINALLDCEGELMVLCAQKGGDSARGHQVWRPGEADAEGVQWMLSVICILRLLHMPARATYLITPILPCMLMLKTLCLRVQLLAHVKEPLITDRQGQQPEDLYMCQLLHSKASSSSSS